MSVLAELKRRNVLDKDVLRSRSTRKCESDQHVGFMRLRSCLVEAGK